jgi:hypothetical protein
MVLLVKFPNSLNSLKGELAGATGGRPKTHASHADPHARGTAYMLRLSAVPSPGRILGVRPGDQGFAVTPLVLAPRQCLREGAGRSGRGPR